MPDPTELPVNETGLPEEKIPQQPQQTQQAQQAQQPQQTQQPQYNYQPQYGYQQPQQPRQGQYGYQQPQQAQYNYQQQPQSQYGYRQQPQQAQYGYQQQPQYGYQQPRYGYQQPQAAYGYRQVQSAPAVTHKKAIGSMIMMFIALSLLIYPLISFLLTNVENAFGYGSTYSWLVLIGHICLGVALVLMLVGAIIGSRGHALFGVGVLLCLVCQLVKRVYYVIDRMDYYEELGVLMLLFGVILIIGTILAGIGCLARVKALKIVGGILMLLNFILARLIYFITVLDRYGSGGIDVKDLLYFFGCIFLCIAVLAFPIRKPKNPMPA